MLKASLTAWIYDIFYLRDKISLWVAICKTLAILLQQNTRVQMSKAENY